MPTLKQIQTQKQKLAPKQVLQARMLQLNTVNLEQAILKELEENPILEQVEPEDFEDKSELQKIINELQILKGLYEEEKERIFNEIIN